MSMAVIKGARIDRVEHDVATNWYSIFPDGGTFPDGEVIKKLQTKLQQKAEEAAAFRRSGELVDIQYSAKDSTNINPHTGAPYRNVYYEKATPSEPEPASNGDVPGIDTIAPEQSTGLRRTHPIDAWRISLAAGAKLAVATLPMLPTDERDLDSQLALALWWAQKLYFTSRPTEAFANRPSGVRQDEWDSPDEFASSADDDIPWD